MSSLPTTSMKEDDMIAIIKAVTIPFVSMAANLDLLYLEFNAMSDREIKMCRRNRTCKPPASPKKSKGTPRRKKNVEKTKGIHSGYQIFVSENSVKGLDLAVCFFLCRELFYVAASVLSAWKMNMCFDCELWHVDAVADEGALSYVGIDWRRQEKRVHAARR